MADVHEVYVDKRRSRAGPIIGLTLVILLLIAIVVAMIMNVHGSISWPAGEMRFGLWPQTTTSTAPTQVASDVTVAISPGSSVSEADIQQADEDVQSSESQPLPAATSPAETEPAPQQ